MEKSESVETTICNHAHAYDDLGGMFALAYALLRFVEVLDKKLPDKKE